MQNGRDDDGPDPVCSHDPYPRYPEGEYEVMCLAAVTRPDGRFRAQGRDGKTRPTWKCDLHCQLLTNQEDVFGFFNMGNEPDPTVTRGGQYRRVWIMANGDPPQKRKTMSKRIFVGRIFRVQIGCTRKTYSGEDHPEGAVYSTIKKFIACVGP